MKIPRKLAADAIAYIKSSIEDDVPDSQLPSELTFFLKSYISKNRSDAALTVPARDLMRSPQDLQKLVEKVTKAEDRPKQPGLRKPQAQRQAKDNQARK